MSKGVFEEIVWGKYKGCKPKLSPEQQYQLELKKLEMQERLEENERQERMEEKERQERLEREKMELWQEFEIRKLELQVKLGSDAGWTYKNFQMLSTFSIVIYKSSNLTYFS